MHVADRVSTDDPVGRALRCPACGSRMKMEKKLQSLDRPVGDGRLVRETRATDSFVCRRCGRVHAELTYPYSAGVTTSRLRHVREPLSHLQMRAVPFREELRSVMLGWARGALPPDLPDVFALGTIRPKVPDDSCLPPRVLPRRARHDLPKHLASNHRALFDQERDDSLVSAAGFPGSFPWTDWSSPRIAGFGSAAGCACCAPGKLTAAASCS